MMEELCKKVVEALKKRDFEAAFRAAPSDALVIAHNGAKASASRRRNQVASVGDYDGGRGEAPHQIGTRLLLFMLTDVLSGMGCTIPKRIA